jgi:hypothetical protein
MRSPPNPQRRVAEVVGDAVGALDPKCAPDDALAILATREYRKHFPPTPIYRPTAFERHATAHREAATAVVAVLALADTVELTLAENGRGECRNSGIAKLEDRISFSLAGVIAEARFNPRSIHKVTMEPAYGLLVARIAIDELNERGGQIHLTYRAAAKRAMVLVDANWGAIENVALALNDCGSMDDYSIRLFARCGR